MHHNWMRITVFAIFAAFLAIALIALQSPQSTSATEFAPASPTTLFIESDSECSGSADDNGNSMVNEGCPKAPVSPPGFAEDDPSNPCGGASLGDCGTAAACTNALNDDPDDTGTNADTLVNDGCPGVSRVGIGQTPDTTSLFDIAEPSAQFAGAVAYTDPAFTIDEHGADADLDLGAVIGLVDSKATLGIINGSCSTLIPVPLVMMNASTDTSDTIDTDGPPDNLLLPLAQDDPQTTALTSAINNSDTIIPVASTTGFTSPTGQVVIDLEKIDYGGVTPTSFTGASRGADSTTPVGHAIDLPVFQQQGAAANDLPDVVDKYPSYLNTIFDKGDGTSLTPRFRYVGVQDVVGLIVILNLVGFDGGELRRVPGGGPAVSGLGTPVVTVLQNPTQATSNSAISDFCSKLETNFDLLGVSNDNKCTITTTAGCSLSVSTSLGGRDIFKGMDGGDTTGESGAIRMSGPGTAGTTTSTQMYLSQRDFDGDGIENGLDACNSTWSDVDGVPDGDPSDNFDPRAIVNFFTDADGDGLDVSCDPDDSILTGQNTDEDGDAYLNRLDICALVANGDTKVAKAVASGTAITVRSTAGFTVGNEIQLSFGVVSERFEITAIGGPSTTLSAGIDASVTTIPLTSAAAFPAGGTTVRIEDELITYTGKSGDNLTGASRGALTTLPDTHAGGATVREHVFTLDAGMTFSHLVGDPAAQIFPQNVNDGMSDVDILFPIPVPDGGPRSDGIGPICDNTATFAGETLSPSIPNGHYHRTATITRSCVLGTDADGDGVCSGFIQIPANGAAESGTDCADAADNDTDGVAGDGCAENDSLADTDGDGVLDGADNCLNTQNAASAGFTQADVDADGTGDICETVNSTTNTNDNDGDGFSNTLEGVVTTASEAGLSGLSECGNATDDDPGDDGGGNETVNDGCPPWGAAETACSDAVDSDRDMYVNDGCPVVGGAGESSSAAGTGPELHCATNSLDTFGSYPPDVDGNGAVGVSDLSLIAGVIGSSTVADGGATPDRRDIGPEPVSDDSITSVDLGAVAAHAGETC